MATELEIERAKKALYEKRLILDALLRDSEHPERFDSKIEDNNAKIKKLQDENTLLATLRDNIGVAIERAERDVKQLEIDLDALNNNTLQQAERTVAKLKELTKGMTVEQLTALLTKQK